MIFILLGAQQHFGIIKNDTVEIDGGFFDNGFGCAGPDSNDEMFTLNLQVIEQGMFLVTSIGYNGLAGGSDGIDKGPFSTLAVCKVNF